MSFFFITLQVLLRQEHHPEDRWQALRLPIRLRPSGSSRLLARGDPPNGGPQDREEGRGLIP